MVKTFRITVATLGVPVEFPSGKLRFSEMRVSTLGNVGNVFIASDSPEALLPNTRFEIAPNLNIPLKASAMDGLWLNAVNANDGLFVFAELELNNFKEV